MVDKNKEEVKVNKKVLSGVIIFIFIIVILLGIFLFSNSYLSSGNVVKEVLSNCKDVQVPYDEQETYYESVPYTDQECDTINLAYSVENEVFDYDTCNKYEEVCNKFIFGVCSDKTKYCVDKSVSCSLDLRNLDSSNSGTWTVKHLFSLTETNEDFKSTQTSIFIYPQSQERVINSVRIQSQGVEGDANKDIGSCFYQIVSIPTKQDCRDVIRYQDVKRTRTVTKYKLETVCD